jgi:site-specific DNA-methyltransferase (adenine-specific)
MRYIASTGGASRFFYCSKASRNERTCNGEIANGHPTVKPLALMEYLCTLTRTPTGGIVLDPFMGSGSTGVACVNTGRDFVGIERAHGSFEIAEARIEHALNQARQLEFA